jgi:hypothetical protein
MAPLVFLAFGVKRNKFYQFLAPVFENRVEQENIYKFVAFLLSQLDQHLSDLVYFRELVFYFLVGQREML